MALTDSNNAVASGESAVLPNQHRGLQRGESTRAQAVFVRNSRQACAMSLGERAKEQVKGLFGLQSDNNEVKAQKSDHHKKQESDDIDDDHHSETNTKHTKTTAAVQYRLEATHRIPKRRWFIRLLCCFGLFGFGNFRGQGVSVNPNQKMAIYLHWMFRVNFVFLFAVMCVFFFALVILFAGFIILAGTMDNECVRIGGLPFAHAGTPFADAFALSWTTFSTVGYGSAYPGLSPQNSSPTNCFFINFICSLEALIGILYSGFCGAILFGKVLRIQSQAQVIFSDPILIRYGPGLADMAYEDDKDQNCPCPVMEFRIVNRLFNEQGGEIMDATLNVVGNVDADDADLSFHNSMHDIDRSLPGTSVISDNDSVSENSGEMSTSRSERSIRMKQLSKMLTPVITSLVSHTRHRDHQAVDEDPTSRLVSKHVFSKMMIEASEHPFFKRVWLARHILDENSPILKPRVRKQIRKNGGKWPERLNNYTGIRDSLQFNQILVSLNGVSNVSASNVYSQKIYDFVDVNIGYQFVNILYRDSDGQLGVDIDLINDVREQVGGGGEPLMLD